MTYCKKRAREKSSESMKTKGNTFVILEVEKSMFTRREMS